uniref:Homeobox domain-containing protein n=1 Tax=Syphacia muris TaxID=451379 RepID=A0A0N5AEZ2_9BILA
MIVSTAVHFCDQLQSNPTASGSSQNRRRFRTNFTENQSVALEEAFQESHYPDQNSKKHLAAILDIPEDRITVWFQNRRAKWRRKEMREKEKKTQADNGLARAVDYRNQQFKEHFRATFPAQFSQTSAANFELPQFYYYNIDQTMFSKQQQT